MQLLRRIADEQQTAILMATHSLEAAGIADAVVKLRDGRIEEVQRDEVAAWVFYRLVVRPLYREPTRTLLTVLAVALGVAVVLAIELAGYAAAGSFRSSMETLTGTANLEVSAVGGVPDAVVGTLATLPYPIKVEPRIDDFATLHSTGQTVPLIGLDLIADQPEGFTDDGQAKADADNLTPTLSGDSVWVSSSLGANSGDTLQLQINDVVRPYTVARRPERLWRQRRADSDGYRRRTTRRESRES